MFLDNSHLSFISSYSAYDRRLTIFVIQLSIYAFCILKDEIQKMRHQVKSRAGQRRSTAPFQKGPITLVMA